MPTQLELLGAARLTGIIQGLYDPRLLPQQPIWVGKRVPIVPATDEEIFARYIGVPVIADIIADDAKAATYTIGKFSFETTRIPNLKFGIPVNQATLNQIDRLVNGYAPPDDMGIFTQWQNTMVANAKSGVLMRMEVLTVAMLLDNLNYDRLGVKLSGVTFGMPSDLKATTAITWDTAATATPVNDILGLKLIASVRYGVNLNRVTMSTQAFRYMIATTEFQNKARQYLAPNVSYTNLALANLQQQQTIAQNVLGMTIELDDRRVWQQDGNGANISMPILPVTSVLLTSTDADGNSMAWDFANAVVTESMLGNGGVVIGQIPNRVRGPISYATLADAALNPPGMVTWGVGRGMPRRKFQPISGALTVGTFSDTISTALPF
jgi:hypothetical protein